MDTMTHPRVPAGNGRRSGEFAATAHSEADAELEPETSGHRWDTDADEAALHADIKDFLAAKARIDLRSARVVSRKVLDEWPEASHLEMDVSDQGDYSMWPVAVLAADGTQLADDHDLEDVDDELMYVVSNLHDDDGDWTVYRTYLGDRGTRPALNLKAAAAIPDADVQSPGQRQQAVEMSPAQQYAEHEATIGDQIRERFYPDAVEWSVGSSEHENGFFYDESAVQVTLADGSTRELDLTGTYAADALTEISYLDSPGRSSEYRAELRKDPKHE